MSKKITLSAVMDLNEEVLDLLSDVFLDMDEKHKLYPKVIEMFDRLADLHNKYFKVDTHAGCPNWPNCDEFGCGD